MVNIIPYTISMSDIETIKNLILNPSNASIVEKPNAIEYLIIKSENMVNLKIFLIPRESTRLYISYRSRRWFHNTSPDGPETLAIAIEKILRDAPADRIVPVIEWLSSDPE